MNIVSNVSNNGMAMNQFSHTKTSTSQNNEFAPFSFVLRVQMIVIDTLNTPLKRNIVINSYIAL